MPAHAKPDKIFLSIVLLLVGAGLLIFTSASMGLLAKQGATFGSVAKSQIFYGLFGGSLMAYLAYRINYRTWRKHAFYIFIAALALNLLLFIPGLYLEHGGARRWIEIGSFSFQPSEFLKLGFVIYFAAWLSGLKNRADTFKLGALPFLIIVGVVGLILLAQPDTDTFIVIFSAALSMFLAAGARWKHILIIILIGLVGFAGIALTRPYVKDRILTYIQPSRDPHGSSYQIQQSLIAIGSGGFFGRGFGQSVQKFDYLPEPIGDSIFAVAAEEFGFFGSLILILLFVALAFRGLFIASRVPDMFGGLLVLGIVILIITQSFMNIGAMLGVLPLTGIPLLFVSHGGTALFITLIEIGIILNVSKYARLGKAKA